MKINDLEFHSRRGGLQHGGAAGAVAAGRLATDAGLEGWGEAGVAWRVGELSARRDALLPVLAGRSVFDIEELHTLERWPARRCGRPSRWPAGTSSAARSASRCAGCWAANIGGGFRWPCRLTGRRPERLARLAREMAAQGFHCQVVSSSGQAAPGSAVAADGARERGRTHGTPPRRPGALRSPDGAGPLWRDRSGPPAIPVGSTLGAGTLPAGDAGAADPRAAGRGCTIRGPADLLAVVRCGAAPFVVLDVEQVGGLAPARACAAVAAAAGVFALLGGRPSLGIGTAAMLHLAAATPALSGCNESAYHQLQDDLLSEPLALDGGMMAIPQGPGFGVEVDRAKIERHAAV